MQTFAQVTDLEIREAESVNLVDPLTFQQIHVWGEAQSSAKEEPGTPARQRQALDIAVSHDDTHAMLGALEQVTRVHGKLADAPRQLLDKLIVLRKYPQAYLYDLTDAYGVVPTWWIRKQKDFTQTPLARAARSPGLAWSAAAFCIQSGTDEVKSRVRAAQS